MESVSNPMATTVTSSFFPIRRHRLASQLSSNWLTLGVAIACVVVYLFPSTTSVLQLENDSSPFRFVYSCLTCHLTHWSLDQLMWDVLAFTVLGCACESYGRIRYLSLLLLAGISVALSVVWIHPEGAAYRGLSGIDSALFVYVAGQAIRTGWRQKDWQMYLGAAAWLLFVGKIVFEVTYENTLFVDANESFRPLPVTHAAGAVAGICVNLISCAISSESNQH